MLEMNHSIPSSEVLLGGRGHFAKHTALFCVLASCADYLLLGCPDGLNAVFSYRSTKSNRGGHMLHGGSAWRQELPVKGFY